MANLFAYKVLIYRPTPLLCILQSPSGELETLLSRTVVFWDTSLAGEGHDPCVVPRMCSSTCRYS